MLDIKHTSRYKKDVKLMNKQGKNKKPKRLEEFIKELDELSKPENMIGPFDSIEDLMKSLESDDDEEDDK